MDGGDDILHIVVDRDTASDDIVDNYSHDYSVRRQGTENPHTMQEDSFHQSLN